MKTNQKLFFPLLAILLALLLPATAYAAVPASPQADKVVLGDNYTLASGETLDGNLIVLGGNVDIQDGASVNGNVFLLGGNLDLNGRVNGDISAAGGNLRIYSSAVVNGNVSSTGASLDVDPAAQISGSVNRDIQGPFVFIPDIPIPNIRVGFNPVTRGLWFLAQVFAFSALAVLIVLFVPKPTRQVAQTAVTQPLVSGGMGLLTLVIAPLALVIMAITLILIPVSLIGIALLGMTIIFGWIGLGLEVGHRLAKAFNQAWADPIEAGLGTFLLTLVVMSVGQIACVGWIAPFLVTILGLGAVLLSRYGTRPYPFVTARPPAQPIPPGPAMPAVPAETPQTPVEEAEPSGESQEASQQEAPSETSEEGSASDESETPSGESEDQNPG